MTIEDLIEKLNLLPKDKIINHSELSNDGCREYSEPSIDYDEIDDCFYIY